MADPATVAKVASAVWSQRGKLGWLLLAAATAPLLLIGVMVAAVGGMQGAAAGAGPSPFALEHIPPEFLKLYQAAGAEYGLGWEYLAAIGQVESHHGRLDTGCETSGAGARGPMQFMPSTWASYGEGGDVCDPEDAIRAAARYLKASGAPDDWDAAIFSYNHAAWYVALVKEWAERYRGPLLTLPGLPASDGPEYSQTLPDGSKWLAQVPGTRAVCDRRIVPDVVMILKRYRMSAGDCFAMSGHATDGEHPLGLGIDLVPGSGGSWALLDRAARDFGWRSSCGASGCAGQLPSPFRFLGWNGYPGHGDPAHAGSGAHLHMSWMHSDTAPGTPAKTVKTLLPPGGDRP